jgi:hypothetical protein
LSTRVYPRAAKKTPRARSSSRRFCRRTRNCRFG